MLKGPFTTLALRNLLFEDKAFAITKGTLELKDEKQSGPRTPPPPIAGDFQAVTPRSARQMLGHSFPAMNR